MDEKYEQLIIQTGILFSKYGIKSMSMDDIAREMGMSKKQSINMLKTKRSW